MKNKIINCIKYLDGTTTIFNANIKRYKILSLILILSIVVLLQSYNIIKIRANNYTNNLNTKISKEYNDTLDKTYDDVYTFMSKDEVSYQLKSMYEMYKLDLKNEKEMISMFEGSVNDIAGKQFGKYMETLQGFMKSSNLNEGAVNTVAETFGATTNMLVDISKNISGIKVSNNEKFKKGLDDILLEINKKNDRSVSKYDQGYLVQKVATKEDDLKQLFDFIVKYNYVIYVKNIPIGVIISKDDKLNIEMLDINTQKIKNLKNKSFTSIELFQYMPKGYPNMALVYEDGTFDISDLILDVLNIDRLSSEAAPYSNIRVVESDLKTIDNIKTILKKYDIGS